MCIRANVRVRNRERKYKTDRVIITTSFLLLQNQGLAEVFCTPDDFFYFFTQEIV